LSGEIKLHDAAHTKPSISPDHFQSVKTVGFFARSLSNTACQPTLLVPTWNPIFLRAQPRPKEWGRDGEINHDTT
jgi:hypothetical protein